MENNVLLDKRSSEIEYVKKLEEMIQNTPRDCEECVNQYHQRILKKLDSGETLEVPSPIHRNLHQNIWMMGYAIYNNKWDLNESNFEFINESEQRKRFDVWYAWKYILNEKLNGWELNLVKSASKSCQEVYHHPLDNLTREELLI